MQIVTVSGATIPLMGNFKPKIGDIAHSLAQNNRYNGHTIRPYSVAQHSVLVSYEVPSHLAFQALLHDAHEAYTVDLPSPVKEIVNHLGDGAWSKFEDQVAGVVRRYFKVPVSTHKKVKEADRKLYLNEIGSLFTDTAKSSFMKLGCTPLYDIMIEPLSVQDSYDLFLNRFFELSNGVV